MVNNQYPEKGGYFCQKLSDVFDKHTAQNNVFILSPSNLFFPQLLKLKNKRFFILILFGNLGNVQRKS